MLLISGSISARTYSSRLQRDLQLNKTYPTLPECLDNTAKKSKHVKCFPPHIHNKQASHKK